MSRKDVYESHEWKRISPLYRPNILLVAEGLKPGSTFGSRYRTNLEKVLKNLNLAYSKPRWFKRGYTYTIAKDEKTLQDNIGMSLHPKLTRPQFHRATGKFYGFPECCTDSYSVSQIYKDKNSKVERWRLFRDVLEEYEKKNGGYPEELDYRMMVPCDVQCKNALELLGNHRDVLQKYDPEAAKCLAKLNRDGRIIISAIYD